MFLSAAILMLACHVCREPKRIGIIGRSWDEEEAEQADRPAALDVLGGYCINRSVEILSTYHCYILYHHQPMIQYELVMVLGSMWQSWCLCRLNPPIHR